MQERILINGITLEEGNLVPLLTKAEVWRSSYGCVITLFGNRRLKERVDELDILKHYCFWELPGTVVQTGKLQFMVEALCRNFRAWRCMKNILGQYDVVYTISSVLDLVIFPYILKQRDCKVKWVTVFDNTVQLKNTGNRFIRLFAWMFFHISLFFLKKADKICVISEELKEYLLRKGFFPSRVMVTGNGVEVDLISRAENRPELATDALFIGRINEAKGIFDMLSVLQIIKRKYPFFRLAVMGRGDPATEAKFRRKIEELDLQKNILMLGFRSGKEKFDYLKSTKVFLFLSKDESFGVAVLEAVCAGVPVIAYDLPVYRKLYPNGEVMVFQQGEYKMIAEAIMACLRQPQKMNSAGSHMKELHSWDAIARKEAAVFTE